MYVSRVAIMKCDIIFILADSKIINAIFRLYTLKNVAKVGLQWHANNVNVYK